MADDLDANQVPPAPLPLLLARLLSGVVVFATGLLLVLAWTLEPAAAGHGTHEQLGLSACSILSRTGWPCPLCGATTTFALMARGQFLQGVWNQPFAGLLYLLTWGFFVLGVAETARPRGRWIRLLARIEPIEGRLAAGLMAGLSLGWIWKAVLMAPWKQAV